ncbi:hypothetical protein BLA60_36945 [Actinophytocola xinjiangensis]|uniref:Uncharacterized protein n=1 Tax=Actinophytocola xinjiangensis TaxID=485602 RepID=A0A7Z0WFQ5_9PSEU|nr:hypothetical protein [Actinophytocola xinjiangensis]OLF05247.1 hypothetical protein BLA60_36945 [Actinophytocola xinjiangensis]
MEDNQGTARRGTRAASLRIAALAGVALSAGAIAVGGQDVLRTEAPDQRVDTVVTGGWPMGSTCCPEGNPS